jgi:hypothetical protein
MVQERAFVGDIVVLWRCSRLAWSTVADLVVCGIMYFSVVLRTPLVMTMLRTPLVMTMLRTPLVMTMLRIPMGILILVIRGLGLGLLLQLALVSVVLLVGRRREELPRRVCTRGMCACLHMCVRVYI